MNYLDYILGGMMLAATIAGFRRGFARTIVGMIALAAATLGSIWMYGTAATFFLDYVSHKAIAGFIGFVAVFALISIIGSIIGWVAQKAVKAAGLGWLDRLMGAGVGLLQSLLVSIALVMAITAFSRNPPPKAIVESQLAPYVIGASEVLAAMAPRELHDEFTNSYAKVKKSWNETVGKGLSKLPSGAF